MTKYYYGVTDRSNIAQCVDRACYELSTSSITNAKAMLMATAAAETGMCTTLDQCFKEGAGPSQIDTVRYGDVIRYINKRQHLVDIFGKNGFDIEQISYIYDKGYAILNYSPMFACFITRVAYMMIPEPFPSHDDYMGQYRYWKKYWNSTLGKGTARHFLSSITTHIDITASNLIKK